MRIIFLCKAGCEGNGQLGLPSGEKFKKETIAAKGAKDLAYYLNKQQSGDDKFRDGCLIAHNSTSILYQTIIEHENDYKKLFDFNKDEQKCLEEYIEIKRNERKREKRVLEGFQDIYKKYFYDKIKNDKEIDGDKNLKNFLEKGCFSHTFCEKE